MIITVKTTAAVEMVESVVSLLGFQWMTDNPGTELGSCTSDWNQAEKTKEDQIISTKS